MTSKKKRNTAWIIGAVGVIAVGVFIWANSQAKSTKALAQGQLNEQPQQAEGDTRQDPNDPWSDFEKPSEEKLKKILTDMEYEVTQEDGTEPSYENKYWDYYKKDVEGIYVDVVSGEPLFSTKNQYKSGTGWPSFTKPLVPSNVITTVDYKLVYPRTEVRSKHADSHLGHVFKAGPETAEEANGAAPTGLRYCLNSAALKFIPKDELEEKGYGDLVSVFEE